jgi:hypothetical protein
MDNRSLRVEEDLRRRQSTDTSLRRIEKLENEYIDKLETMKKNLEKIEKQKEARRRKFLDNMSSNHRGRAIRIARGGPVETPIADEVEADGVIDEEGSRSGCDSTCSHCEDTFLT